MESERPEGASEGKLCDFITCNTFTSFYPHVHAFIIHTLNSQHSEEVLLFSKAFHVIAVNDTQLPQVNP